MKEQKMYFFCFFSLRRGWVERKTVVTSYRKGKIMQEERNIRELATQYFEGRISRTDEGILFEYINRSKAHHLEFKSWEKEWLRTGAASAGVEGEWTRLLCKMRTREAVAPMIALSKNRFWKRVAAVAAVVILTAGSTIGIWQMISSLQAETYFTCETPLGEKSKVILSDGTVVWLNAGSTLKYSNKFNETNRKVELNGEGYFEVTKKNGEEFIVQTNAYDVVVKGTKFNVTAYSDDDYASTTLLEGAVELDYQGKQMAMSPGEAMRLDLESGKFIRSQVNAAQSKAWAENRIEFDDITLEELVAKLSRQYDVNIRLESNKVGKKKFRISLRNRETIGEVMTALQQIIPITVERKGKDIYIR